MKNQTQQPSAPALTPVQKSAASVTAFICGLLSILTSPFYYLALPLGILGIVFGTISAHRVGSKLGKAGLILGIIGLSLFVLLYATLITAILLKGNGYFYF